MPTRDSDELVRRLRRLSWPTVPEDVRDRCWEELSVRLAGRETAAEEDGAAAQPSRRNVGHRLEYTRRVPTRTASRLATAARTPLWAAGPQRGVLAARAG
jgi:hypothetical protein